MTGSYGGHAPITFADRRAAGRRLAAAVGARDLAAPLVLALPRGGVPVAYEVAEALAAPLDVLVARKLGAPHQPELGIGAIAEGGGHVVDHRAVAALGITRAQLDAILAREEQELARRVARYRRDRPRPSLQDRTVVLVDDGLATGVTAVAAARSLTRLGADRILVAVPVGAEDAVTRLRHEGCDVECLATPVFFRAVGQWYDAFDQTTDAEVEDLLARSGR